MHDPTRKPRHVGSLGQDDGHFELSEVVTAFVKFQLPKGAKRPRFDESDGGFAERIVCEGPGDIFI